MGDVTMNDDDATQPMQAFDVDADESPLHSVKPDLAAVSLAMEDRRAQTDALRDAARAALAAATNDNLVLPVPGLNPYQQNALGAPPPPTTLAPLRKEGKGPKDRLESPEKKPKTEKTRREGLGPTPLFGGSMSSAPAAVPKEQPLQPLRTAGPPEFYNLDQQAPPAWVSDLREMMVGGQRELMSELQSHKTHLAQVVTQVQGIDDQQQDLAKAHKEMQHRMSNMEAEVRNLKSRSRSVSPAPPPPDQSPRSTAASTARERPPVDDLQLVIGGWDDARRGEIEQEIRDLFTKIEASPLLLNMHIPFVRSRFARVELLFTTDSLAERRRIQTLTLEALKKALTNYTSVIQGQQGKRLWVTRNRSKEDREKIRALVSMKDYAKRYLDESQIDLDWRGRLWLKGEQALYWHIWKKPGEGSIMLTNAAGDETGWWIDSEQFAKLLNIPSDRVRQELTE